MVARGLLVRAWDSSVSQSIDATEADVGRAPERAGPRDHRGLNGPQQTVISGDRASVEALGERFAAAKGRRVRRLAVSPCFPQPHMDSMLDALEAVARMLLLGAGPRDA